MVMPDSQMYPLKYVNFCFSKNDLRILAGGKDLRILAGGKDLRILAGGKDLRILAAG